MPRALVLLRPSKPEDGDFIEQYLREARLNWIFTKETGTVLEYYMRTFGWPDFVISLSGPNQEALKEAILHIRVDCQSLTEIGEMPITSSLVGRIPEDPYLRVAEHTSECLSELMQDLGRKLTGKKLNEENACKELATTMALEEAYNYIALHRAFLDKFENQLNEKVQTKEGRRYKSCFQKNRELLDSVIHELIGD